MSQDLELIEQFRLRLVDRYTATELVDLLDITIEEILEAFEEKWQENAFLQEEVGINLNEDDD